MPSNSTDLPRPRRRKPRPGAPAARFFRRLHSDDQGAISVLALLTMWCLVALLAMVWNTAEESARKQRLQTAADTAAHAVAAEMARITNTTTGMNLVICQDASTETIWNAMAPTRDGILKRLGDELTRLATNPANSDQIRRLIETRLEAVDKAWDPLRVELLALLDDTGCGITDPKELKRHQNEKRRARSVIAWVHDTYVEGLTPVSSGGPPRPLPPMYDGQVGLRNIVINFKPKQTDAAIVQMIGSFISTTENQAYELFKARCEEVLADPVPAIMQAHRNGVYQDQLALIDAFPQRVESQRRDIAAYYNAQVTLAGANPLSSTGDPPPAWDRGAEDVDLFYPPVMPADRVQPVHHFCSIRGTYATLALLAFKTDPPALQFDIDPINPHTDVTRIWHPGGLVPVNARTPWGNVTMQVGIGADLGWGASWAVPIEHYFRQRVDADLAGIRDAEMKQLDDARAMTLAALLRTALGAPAEGVISQLPITLPDDQPDPDGPEDQPPVYKPLPVPYRLERPAAALSTYRDHIDRYNRYAPVYCAAVRSLWRAINDYRNSYGYYIERFAVRRWYAEVSTARFQILKNLGTQKAFTTVRTYGLREVPAWAQGGMQDSVSAAVTDELIRRNENSVIEAIVNFLVEKNRSTLGGMFLDPQERDRYLRIRLYPYAVAAARDALRPAVAQIAAEITHEWMRRPWPYEIAPPPDDATPSGDLSRPDRFNVFTAVAAAREPANVPSRLLFQRIFKTGADRPVATAQADAFSWMEFNENYGGGERYDQVTASAWSTYGILGAPRSWRNATFGGWNWRSRLSVGDATFDAARTNPEFRQFLNDAGLNTSDRESFDALQLH